MDLRPAHGGQQPVRHFEVENMTELVARSDRAVWQLTSRAGDRNW